MKKITNTVASAVALMALWASPAALCGESVAARHSNDVVDAAGPAGVASETVAGRFDRATRGDRLNRSRSTTATCAPASPCITLVTRGEATVAGSIVRAEVWIDGGGEVTDAPFTLAYNPEALEFVGASEGRFLDADDHRAIFLARSDATRGAVRIGLSRMARTGGVSGDGMLASVTFKVKGDGQAGLALTKYSVRGSDGSFVPVSVSRRMGRKQSR